MIWMPGTLDKSPFWVLHYPHKTAMTETEPSRSGQRGVQLLRVPSACAGETAPEPSAIEVGRAPPVTEDTKRAVRRSRVEPWDILSHP